MHTDDTDDATPTEGTARRLKLRALLAEYRPALVVVCVALVVLGAWVSYGAYAASGEETERRLEPAWTATGEFSHGATVTQSTPVHANGTVLENEPLYYAAVSPKLEGEFVGGYEADSARNVDVNVTVDLVYRAVDPETGTVYWSQRDHLASASETDVAPGEGVTAAFAVDVTEVAAEIDEIESDLGASPGETEIYLDVNREIEGEIEGEHRAASDGYAVGIEYDGSTYTVDAEERYDADHGEEYETVVVPASVGPTRTIGGPLLLILGAAGVAGLAAARKRLPAPTAAEREWLAYHEDRERFEEVITRVRLPPSELEFGSPPASASASETTADTGKGTTSEPEPQADSGFEFVEGNPDDRRSGSEATPSGYATVESLAELAQLGIDVGAAVVFDRRSGRYLVRHRGTTYVFEPPTLEPSTGTDPATEDGSADVDSSSDSEGPDEAVGDPERAFARATADEEADGTRAEGGSGAFREYADRLRSLLGSGSDDRTESRSAVGADSGEDPEAADEERDAGRAPEADAER